LCWTQIFLDDEDVVNTAWFIGPLQESAVWIDESATCGAVFGRIRATSPIVNQDLEDPLGISDEASE